METIPWSAERHICQDDLDGFKGNINCMRWGTAGGR